jgi:hypothetical protein
MEVLDPWVQQVLLVLQVKEAKEEGMDLLANLASGVLMEQWVLRENLVLSGNLVVLDFLEFLEQKEILGELVLKAALGFRVQEENLVNLACLENLVKWVHLEKMEATERKEALVFLVLLDLPDSLAQEANLV